LCVERSKQSESSANGAHQVVGTSMGPVLLSSKGPLSSFSLSSALVSWSTSCSPASASASATLSSETSDAVRIRCESRLRPVLCRGPEDCDSDCNALDGGLLDSGPVKKPRRTRGDVDAAEPPTLLSPDVQSEDIDAVSQWRNWLFVVCRRGRGMDRRYELGRLYIVRMNDHWHAARSCGETCCNILLHMVNTADHVGQTMRTWTV
jgi:hypothetical protein